MISDTLTTMHADLDALIDQASIFITADAVDMELAHRLHHHVPVGAWAQSEAAGAMLRSEVKFFLAHESVEEMFDTHLELFDKLELSARKEEVKRRIDKLAQEVWVVERRRAA